MLLLGMVISSEGSSCVDGPPIALGEVTRREAAGFGMFVGSRSVLGASERM